MNAIKNDVEALVGKELASANRQFPLFNSVHEAYAIMKEEAEETQDALGNTENALNKFWVGVKENLSQEWMESSIADIRKNALQTAIEAIQVAAMCDKFTLSFVSDSLGGGRKLWLIIRSSILKVIMTQRHMKG